MRAADRKSPLGFLEKPVESDNECSDELPDRTLSGHAPALPSETASISADTVLTGHISALEARIADLDRLNAILIAANRELKAAWAEACEHVVLAHAALDQPVRPRPNRRTASGAWVQ
jgi:hypothetical protein